MIKTGGEWVSSLQIEDLISQCAGVHEAAVIGVKDDRWGERPLALVVKQASDAQCVSDRAIKDHLKVFADKGVISKYGIPEKIMFIDSTPQDERRQDQQEGTSQEDTATCSRRPSRS